MPFFIIPSDSCPVETINRVTFRSAFGDFPPGILRFGNITQLTDVSIEAGDSLYRFDRQLTLSWIFLSGSAFLKSSAGTATELKAGDLVQLQTGSGVSWSLDSTHPSEPLHFLEIQSLPGSLFPHTSIEKFGDFLSYQQQWSEDLSQGFRFFSGEFLPFEEFSVSFTSPAHGMLIRIIQGSVMIGGTVVNSGDWVGVYDYDRIQIMPQTPLTLIATELVID